MMEDSTEEYTPFYHPAYGWQWLNIKPTPEQKLLGEFKSKLNQREKDEARREKPKQ